LPRDHESAIEARDFIDALLRLDLVTRHLDVALQVNEDLPICDALRGGDALHRGFGLRPRIRHFVVSADWPATPSAFDDNVFRRNRVKCNHAIRASMTKAEAPQSARIAAVTSATGVVSFSRAKHALPLPLMRGSIPNRRSRSSSVGSARNFAKAGGSMLLKA